MEAVLVMLPALLPGVPPRAAPPRMSATRAPKEVVVVGGGWAGYTIADALSASPDVHVTLLEARPSTGGLAGGWRTPRGRPVEAGVHGFWREYRNTFATMQSVGLDVQEVLTPYTPSVLVSKAGRVATAPVLGSAPGSAPGSRPASAARWLPFSPQALLAKVAELLPPPLDTALLAEFAPGSRLNAADRVSAIGLLPAWADFGQEERESWLRYDDITAENLFKRYGGVSARTYEDLVEPLLHVLPMGPGADISAAAALSCFHVFALQARGAFDVRWCRGSVSDRVFTPWLARLEARPNFTLRAGLKVACIAQAAETSGAGAQLASWADGGGSNVRDGRAAEAVGEDEAEGLPVAHVSSPPPSVSGARAREAPVTSAKPRLEVRVEGGEELFTADAVVLAVGATAAARLRASSPVLLAQPSTRGFDRLRGITCVAVRLYLSPASYRTAGLGGGAFDSTLLPAQVASAMVASPVLVAGPAIGGLPELRETGFCVYDLQRLHPELASGDLAVLEVDFYRADTVAELPDDAVTRLALRAAAAALGLPAWALPSSLIVDAAVVRARRAVSHFDPGSAKLSPPVTLGGGVYACGDWVDRCGHASWSTEKSVVTAKQAAAAIAWDLRLSSVDAEVIPAAPDTAQLRALRRLARSARATGLTDAAGLPVPAPWVSLVATLS